MGLAHRRSFAALAPLALAALLALPGSAGAALQWSAPKTLGEGYGGAGYGSARKNVHIDARGDVLALWHQGEVVDGESVKATFYAWRAPGGRWTPVRQLGPAAPAPDGPVVALTPRGHAVALWQLRGTIFTAETNVGGEFGDGQALGRTNPDSAADLDIAVDDAGNALAAWQGNETRQPGPNGASGWEIFTATRTPEGKWSDAQLLQNEQAVVGPDISMNAAGAAVIAWAESVYNRPPQRISYRPPAGQFGASELLPAEGFGIPTVAIGDSGEAVVVTADIRFAGRQHPEGNSLIAVRHPVGGWSEPVRFVTAEPPRGLSLAPDGSATMFMTDNTDRDHPQAQYVTRLPDGEVEGPVTVASNRFWSDIATNLRGDLLTSLTTPSFRGPVELAERPGRSATFGPPGPSPGAVDSSRVALNDAGQAAISWVQEPPSVWSAEPTRVRIAVREDPALPVLPFPPTVEIDAPDVPQLEEDGTFRIAVKCSTRCKAQSEGLLAPGGDAQLVAGEGPSKKLGAKRRGVLKVRFGREQFRSVRKAIRAGRKPWVSVSVRARGRSPRPTTVSRRIRLR